MAERTPPPDPDVAAYLLGKLEPGERARFEQRLAEEPQLREAAAELEGTVALLGHAAPPFEVPSGLEARTLAAVRREAAGTKAEPAAAAKRRRFRLPALRPLALAGGVALALAAAVLVGTQLGGDEELPGTLELEATLLAPGGSGDASTAVRETPAGRVVTLRSDDLPVLPEGEFYELWFVGPGDAPGDPNRISAGTFHPDEEGNSDVRFHAAVDPSKYPVVAVTEEPGDGDPRPTRPDVLRSRAGG